MKQKFKRRSSVSVLALTMALVLSSFTSVNLQAQERISGVVKDVGGLPLPGVSILQKGTTRGAVTDFDGNYSIELASSGQKTLVYSYLGFKTVEIPVNGRTTIDVNLEEEVEGLDEVVVVGYGTQKKESVVGSISQVKGEDLQELTLGVANITEALQGQIPGVATIQGSGRPGNNDLQIFIRGQASWNGVGQPLVLVDGVERSINNVDFSEVETLSVLKDASATAVFGVQGANGVILITTKRGKTGKAQLSLQANTTFKVVSKLPEKLGVVDAIREANSSILRELAYREDSWVRFRPDGIIDRYINPANENERNAFPDINWREFLLKDFAQDYRVNLSARGGSKKARYFANFAYQKETDIFNGKSFDNGRGYESEFSYDRINFRSNVDFDLTTSTHLAVNLGGFYATQVTPGNGVLRLITNSIYELAPNVYTPIYPDGSFGGDFGGISANSNPVASLTSRGYTTESTFQINSDFILNQELDFITKGLKLTGRFSLDNTAISEQELIDPSGNNVTRVYDPEDPFTQIVRIPDGDNDFAFRPEPWTITPQNIRDNSLRVNSLIDIDINYANTFSEKHNVTALAKFRRQERGQPNDFSVFREDWIGRVTYNYDTRYFIDISGAYNGSEKFGPGFRFDLFPAVALGWTPSNEKFMSNVDWVNLLKFRGSYGLIGDDSGGSRFEYQRLWRNGGGAFIDPTNTGTRSPYVFFAEDNVGNPLLQWETAIKYNVGLELGLFKNTIKAEFDYFGENRDNIFIPSSGRAISDLFGASPPSINKGVVEVRGYEINLSANYTFGNGLNIFGNFQFAQAKDLTIVRDDPAFQPFYQKDAGYPIGQPRLPIPGQILGSLDDLYSSTPRILENNLIRTGYYNVVDFNGDGVYDSNFDNVPYGYPNRPQRTWSSTIGANYKGFQLQIQLYGTQNSSKNYTSRTFVNLSDTFFTFEQNYWTKDNPTATRTQPVYALNQIAGQNDPYSNFWDSSLVRLRSIALNYKVPKRTCEQLGVKALTILANGNNLFLWTDLPDDREFNSGSESSIRGDYPTMARFNFGVNIDF